MQAGQQPVKPEGGDGPNSLEAARAVKELVDRYGVETVIGLAKLFRGEG
jgi:hypothetical protein